MFGKRYFGLRGTALNIAIGTHALFEDRDMETDLW